MARLVLEQLPKAFQRHLDNLEIVIKKRPIRKQLEAVGSRRERVVLYGLYEGTPLPERSALSPPLLPDRITIFSEPLVRDFADPLELRRQIRLTLIHEIAHYFGMEEDKIEKLGY